MLLVSAFFDPPYSFHRLGVRNLCYAALAVKLLLVPVVVWWVARRRYRR